MADLALLRTIASQHPAVGGPGRRSNAVKASIERLIDRARWYHSLVQRAVREGTFKKESERIGAATLHVCAYAAFVSLDPEDKVAHNVFFDRIRPLASLKKDAFIAAVKQVHQLAAQGHMPPVAEISSNAAAGPALHSSTTASVAATRQISRTKSAPQERFSMAPSIGPAAKTRASSRLSSASEALLAPGLSASTAINPTSSQPMHSNTADSQSISAKAMQVMNKNFLRTVSTGASGYSAAAHVSTSSVSPSTSSKGKQSQPSSVANRSAPPAKKRRLSQAEEGHLAFKAAMNKRPSARSSMQQASASQLSMARFSPVSSQMNGNTKLSNSMPGAPFVATSDSEEERELQREQDNQTEEEQGMRIESEDELINALPPGQMQGETQVPSVSATIDGSSAARTTQSEICKRQFVYSSTFFRPTTADLHPDHGRDRDVHERPAQTVDVMTAATAVNQIVRTRAVRLTRNAYIPTYARAPSRLTCTSAMLAPYACRLAEMQATKLYGGEYVDCDGMSREEMRDWLHKWEEQTRRVLGKSMSD